LYGDDLIAEEAKLSVTDWCIEDTIELIDAFIKLDMELWNIPDLVFKGRNSSSLSSTHIKIMYQ
jgi:hypothetical protein